MKIELTKTQPSLERDQMLSRRKKQTGFSFVEVIVAALILSTSILGIAGLQIISMKGTQQSAMKGQAMGVIQNLAERMRSNYKGVVDGDYVLADSNAVDCTKLAPVCSGISCAADQIAKLDTYNLVCGYGNSPRTGGVKRTTAGDIGILVNGKLKVSCVAGNCSAGDVIMRVEWIEGTFGTEKVTGTPDSLVLRTRITPP